MGRCAARAAGGGKAACVRPANGLRRPPRAHHGCSRGPGWSRRGPAWFPGQGGLQVSCSSFADPFSLCAWPPEFILDGREAHLELKKKRCSSEGKSDPYTAVWKLWPLWRLVLLVVRSRGVGVFAWTQPAAPRRRLLCANQQCGLLAAFLSS